MTKKESEGKLRWWLDFVQTDIEELSDRERGHLQFELGSYYVPSSFPPNLPEGWWYPVEDLKKIQRIIKQFLKRALRQEKPEDGIIRLPKLPRELKVTGEGRWEISYPRQFYLKNHKRPMVLKKEWMIGDFAELLNGLPRDVIKRCEECKTYFLHLSAKQKKYCSSKCAYRFHSTKKREELRRHPRKYKAYLKQQRELMKRKYDEKIKREHPKAKIGRKEV